MNPLLIILLAPAVAPGGRVCAPTALGGLAVKGGLFRDELSVSLVPEGLAPAALPERLDPGQADQGVLLVALGQVVGHLIRRDRADITDQVGGGVDVNTGQAIIGQEAALVKIDLQGGIVRLHDLG